MWETGHYKNIPDYETSHSTALEWTEASLDFAEPPHSFPDKLVLYIIQKNVLSVTQNQITY